MAEGRRAVARVATVRTSVAAPRPASTEEIDPAFHRAILKIALELKKPGAPGYDEIVDATVRQMRLDAAAFRRYLGHNGAGNMSLLLAAARSGGL